MNYALANLISLTIQIFSVLILVEVMGSWITMLRVNLPGFVYDMLRGVQSITGVILNPIRRVIPSIGGLDITPIIALILLNQVIHPALMALLR